MERTTTRQQQCLYTDRQWPGFSRQLLRSTAEQQSESPLACKYTSKWTAGTRVVTWASVSEWHWSRSIRPCSGTVGKGRSTFGASGPEPTNGECDEKWKAPQHCTSTSTKRRHDHYRLLADSQQVVMVLVAVTRCTEPCLYAICAPQTLFVWVCPTSLLLLFIFLIISPSASITHTSIRQTDYRTVHTVADIRFTLLFLPITKLWPGWSVGDCTMLILMLLLVILWIIPPN